MAQHLADLPSEVRFEIFSFLSVKHVANLLSLNKSTHDQLINSNTFWRNLLNGYSAKKHNQETPKFDDDIDSLKEKLMDIIFFRKQDRRQLECMNEDLLCEISDLEETMQVMKSDPEVLEEFKAKREEIKEMLDQLQIKIQNLIID